MTEYLFAYGTLKSGRVPTEIAATIKTLKSFGTGSVRGTLYDLGKYPGLRLEGADEISGQVFEFHDASVLAALDAYEGYDFSKPSRSLFVRKQCKVRLREKDKDLLCWVYEYNRQPPSSKRIGTWTPRSHS